MKKILFLFSLLSLPAYAGTSNLDVVTVSRTLTLTSPSAYISMTGVSSTANFRTVSASLVSTINISATTIIGNGLGLAKAWGKLNGNSSCTVTAGYNVASCTRITTGTYGISFTTPMVDANYAVVGTARGGTSNPVDFIFSGEAGSASISPTTTGFIVKTNAGGTVYSGQDSGDIQFHVFGN